MGVVDRLNALDEKAGLGRSVSARTWARWTRLWWLGLAVVSVVLAAVVRSEVPLVLGGVPAVFWSGFFYNERLRALRRRPLLMRTPDSWPDETT